MKNLHLAACALASVALVACAPMATVGSSPSNTAGLSAADQLKVLKEVNRHIETCTRTYAWPFAVTIHCDPVSKGGVVTPATTVTQTISPADVAAIVDQAVAKALAAQKPPA